MKFNKNKNRILSAFLAFMFVMTLFDVNVVKAEEVIQEIDHVIINQVFGGGDKGDTAVSHNFIEIANPTDQIIDLSGWTIEFENASAKPSEGKIDLEGVLEANQRLFIKGKAESIKREHELYFTADDADCDMFISDLVLDNKDCKVILKDDNGNIVDIFGRGSLIGEGTSVETASKHTVYARNKYNDTDDNANDFIAYDFNKDSNALKNYMAAGLNPSKGEVVEPPTQPEKPDTETPEPPVEEDIFNRTPIEDTVDIEKIAGFFTGDSSKDGGVAEIIKYNKDNNKFYTINGVASKIHIVSLDNLNGDEYTQLEEDGAGISVKELVEVDGFVYGDMTSIAINTDRDEIAVAVQEADYSKEGKIVIVDYDGNLKSIYSAGIQPDMITYSTDGKYILTANEGEPRNGLGGENVDPEGSVTIVDIEKNQVKNVGFKNANIDSKVHIRTDLNGNKIDAKYDLEPEYIAINEDSTVAYVSLQENNAIAIIDIALGEVKEVKGLGYKDHSIETNALDAVNNGKIQIEALPIKGLYMPDSITYYNGYIITANEGDATEWGKKENAFKNIDSFKNIKAELSLDANDFAGYSSQQELEAKLEEMKNSDKYDKLEVLTDVGNDAIYTLGGRSFSIWNAETMELVYDSGNDFETITAQRYPDYFNVSNSKNEKDARSTKKGPEPEEVKIGQVGDKICVFVGIERTGGVMTYDITDMSNVKFSNYINTRDFSQAFGGDSAPESIDFIHASISPTGYPLMLVANEVSGTVAIMQINEGKEEAEEETTEIKLFHTNDTHSRVDNFPKMEAYVKGFEGNSLLLDAGDTFHGQSFATLENGSSIAKILKAMGYDAMVPGNHDFNYGQDRLGELGIEANLPVLAVNVKKDGKVAYEDVIIKEVNGVKVGILGIATPETAYKTNPNNVIGLDFGTLDSIVLDTQNAVDKLKEQGADVVVALSHVGVDTSSEVKITDVAAKVNGIDVVIDGHSHSALDKYTEFNNNHETKITSTGEYLGNFGEVTLVLNENNEVVDIKLETVDTSELTEKDEAIETLINDIKEAQKPILDVVVGKTPILLDGLRENVRSGHTNLGRLITSAMLDETGADIALTNGGGIRDSIQAGDITKGDVIKVLPFGNYIVTKKVKGQDIIDALNFAMKELNGGFPHFAGMSVKTEKYTDAEGVVRWRVVSVDVKGEAMDPNKEYVLATNDFMAVGGDGYTMFGEYPTLNEYLALDEALINYISKVGEAGIIAVDAESRLEETKVIEISNLKQILLDAKSNGFEVELKQQSTEMVLVTLTKTIARSVEKYEFLVKGTLEEAQIVLEEVKNELDNQDKDESDDKDEPSVDVSPEEEDKDEPSVDVKPDEENKDEVVNKEEENKEEGSLPNTGGRNYIPVIGLALILTAIGATLVMKKKDDIA